MKETQALLHIYIAWLVYIHTHTGNVIHNRIVMIAREIIITQYADRATCAPVKSISNGSCTWIYYQVSSTSSVIIIKN